MSGSGARSVGVADDLGQLRERDLAGHELVHRQRRRLVERDVAVVEQHAAARQGDAHGARRAVVVRLRRQDVAGQRRVVGDAHGQARRILERRDLLLRVVLEELVGEELLLTALRGRGQDLQQLLPAGDLAHRTVPTDNVHRCRS